MKRLEGRVAIVTGAGRGLGRAHAHFLAGQGASVVVNDLGSDIRGGPAEGSPAEEVVNEIISRGGKAVSSRHDISNWMQAADLVDFAVATFGDLHILVNNAGILRDRTIANTTEDEWDSVIRVHLKGHAAPSHHAVAYWRERAKMGREVKASIIHTTSISAFAANFGQASYGAAKLGIVALSGVIALEGARYGIRSNAIAPSAKTRLALGSPEAEALFGNLDVGDGFDRWNPDNISPLIGWLAEAKCPATSQIFNLIGNKLRVLSMPPIVHELEADGRWTLEALDRELSGRLIVPKVIAEFL